jgi:hypothetical protein
LTLELERNISERRRELIEDLLSHELDALSRFKAPHRPYSLMARQVIDEFIAALVE